MNIMIYSYLFYSEQPHDWDEDEDGIWRPPKIPNPAYKGPWKPKVCPRVPKITKKDCGLNSLYLWVSLLTKQKIKNPNYKGKWKIPWIDNPGKAHF